MSIEFQKPQCQGCGLELDESPSLPLSKRKPCPKCGSTVRKILISVHDTVKVRIRMKMKDRRLGKKKPSMEQMVEDSYWRDGKKDVDRLMILDHDNDKYYELIKDPETGVIIHECSEPLSQHRGHGSAKSKKKKKKKSKK